MMNDNNKPIREEIRRQNSLSRFQLTPVAKHVHNGGDSPFIYMPTVAYTGAISYSGRPYNILPFPSGWKIEKGSTNSGRYRITHNLGTTLYTVVVIQLKTTPPNPDNAAGSVFNMGPKTFEVEWKRLGAATTVDTSFNFLLTQINNAKPGWPLYNNVLPK